LNILIWSHYLPRSIRPNHWHQHRQREHHYIPGLIWTAYRNSDREEVTAEVYAQIESRQQFRHAVMMRTADVAVCVEDEANYAVRICAQDEQREWFQTSRNIIRCGRTCSYFCSYFAHFEP
ncbi:hypothetical protein, partial [Prosthecobacter sp.]|uniref:hypothetical protein n=1 Tax=Prosthecobacter sp. TaxID=1965333 RepID=UPI0025F37B7D